MLTIADYDYPNYLFHIYSMISRFDVHCDFNILFLLLIPCVPVIMAVFFVILFLKRTFVYVWIIIGGHDHKTVWHDQLAWKL